VDELSALLPFQSSWKDVRIEITAHPTPYGYYQCDVVVMLHDQIKLAVADFRNWARVGQMLNDRGWSAWRWEDGFILHFLMIYDGRGVNTWHKPE
jgi:hypothetical protein